MKKQLYNIFYNTSREELWKQFYLDPGHQLSKELHDILSEQLYWRIGLPLRVEIFREIKT